MKDLVKYHNELNALEFKKFTATDFDFLIYLCSQLRDNGTDSMTFSLAEIREATGYDYHTSNKEFIKSLRKMNRKLMSIQASVDHEDGDADDFVLFPNFHTSPKTSTLTVDVNKKFAYILNELTKNFTQFELKDFVALNSKYSKTLYRLLKQFRSTGEYYASVDELRRLLCCPESYGNKYFMRDIIMPAVKELQKDFPTLSCEPRRARTKGRPIVGYHFTFKADGQIPGQVTLDQAAEEMKKYNQKKTPERKKSKGIPDGLTHDHDYAELERQLLRKENFDKLSE